MSAWIKVEGDIEVNNMSAISEADPDEVIHVDNDDDDSPALPQTPLTLNEEMSSTQPEESSSTAPPADHILVSFGIPKRVGKKDFLEFTLSENPPLSYIFGHVDVEIPGLPIVTPIDGVYRCVDCFHKKRKKELREMRSPNSLPVPVVFVSGGHYVSDPANPAVPHFCMESDFSTNTTVVQQFLHTSFPLPPLPTSSRHKKPKAIRKSNVQGQGGMVTRSKTAKAANVKGKQQFGKNGKFKGAKAIDASVQTSKGKSHKKKSCRAADDFASKFQSTVNNVATAAMQRREGAKDGDGRSERAGYPRKNTPSCLPRKGFVPRKYLKHVPPLEDNFHSTTPEEFASKFDDTLESVVSLVKNDASDVDFGAVKWDTSGNAIFEDDDRILAFTANVKSDLQVWNEEGKPLYYFCTGCLNLASTHLSVMTRLNVPRVLIINGRFKMNPKGDDKHKHLCEKIDKEGRTIPDTVGWSADGASTSTNLEEILARLNAKFVDDAARYGEYGPLREVLLPFGEWGLAYDSVDFPGAVVELKLAHLGFKKEFLNHYVCARCAALKVSEERYRSSEYLVPLFMVRDRMCVPDPDHPPYPHFCDFSFCTRGEPGRVGEMWAEDEPIGISRLRRKYGKGACSQSSKKPPDSDGDYGAYAEGSTKGAQVSGPESGGHCGGPHGYTVSNFGSRADTSIHNALLNVIADESSLNTK